MPLLMMKSGTRSLSTASINALKVASYADLIASVTDMDLFGVISCKKGYKSAK